MTCSTSELMTHSSGRSATKPGLCARPAGGSRKHLRVPVITATAMSASRILPWTMSSPWPGEDVQPRATWFPAARSVIQPSSPTFPLSLRSCKLRPRMGSDHKPKTMSQYLLCFNPRPLMGGRQSIRNHLAGLSKKYLFCEPPKKQSPRFYTIQ